ncbi:MAG: PTS sugar transporter subunit IIA [Erysipelotrichaceae bacterium]|nr:PTS sugar transporter subunit IIA [Erysipelotrichaceae bacterium]
MKERENRILEYIIEHNRVGLEELLQEFSISKRTLYYDIESINYHIRNCGQIKNIERSFCYVGNYHSLQDILNNTDERYNAMENRKPYILYQILNQHRKLTIESLAEEMYVSKNTIVQTLDEIKKDLAEQGLALKTRPAYEIAGDEWQIRSLYILLMQEDNNLLNHLQKEVLAFDRAAGLNLTDYSLATLSQFCSFLKKRFSSRKWISPLPFKDEVQQFPYYPFIKNLIADMPEAEQIYLGAYISSLPSLNAQVEASRIKHYVETLMTQFEARTAVSIDSPEEFKKNIERHLLSSYYRIKFRFPIANPSLEEIKRNHGSLFKIIKNLIEDESRFPDFKGIREEEIGFLAAYFGGYLRGSKTGCGRKNKVLLVCPNGLMVSKTLEIQLYNYIPAIQIIGNIALKDLPDFQAQYDYIVSTISIPDHENVLVVNPLLTRLDIDMLMSKLIHISAMNVHFDVESIMHLVKQHASDVDENKLKQDLERLLYKREEKENYQPMLKELLNEKRIRTADHVDNWKSAIELAAKPLLEEGTIEQTYVDQMIASVEEHGPYIVLADEFALPHASAASGVHELSMSLLIVKEPVDLLGKPVRLFMVLATIDNSSHMKALASLTEILYDDANMKLFQSGDISAIMKLIQDKG